MHKLPVYLFRDELIPGMPPEQRYTVVQAPGAVLTGRVISPYRLSLQPDVGDVLYHHPDDDAAGYYVLPTLLRCAGKNLYDLRWEPAAGLLAGVSVAEADGEAD